MVKPRRETGFYLRLSPAEKKAIQDQADRDNFSSVSDFMRKTILDRSQYGKTIVVK